MDEAVDGAFPPARRPLAMVAQPAFIGRPMAWLVLADDLENPGQDRVAANESVGETRFDLTESAALGPRNHAAKAVEQFVSVDDLWSIQPSVRKGQATCGKKG